MALGHEGDRIYTVTLIAPDGHPDVVIYENEAERDEEFDMLHSAPKAKRDFVYCSGIWISQEEYEEIEAFNNGAAL
jgi:hypothetical protein